MNILADESVEFPVIERLRSDGHIVHAITEQSQGMPDSQVLDRAVRDHLLLLTADRDFGDIIVRDLRQAPAEGVVLYRLRQIPVAQKASIVADVFAQRAAQLVGAFTVIERDRVRHRPRI